MDPKDEIKQKIDIAELIGEYLPLKPAGPMSFKALCPFHTEKTPSFHVSSDKQFWHCFGCNEGGDCFAFVMKMEGMDFPEALQHLGKKAGVEVKRYTATETNEKQRLLEANELAGKYYAKVLSESAAAATARDYLSQRGIGSELVARFALGFAPDSWDGLTAFLGKRGFQPKEIEKAGLALRRRDGSGVFDRFRNRVMIPLCDQHGNVIGFTGRILPKGQSSKFENRRKDEGQKEEGPKYMNSPETPIYHKGSTLYGLHLAKQAIKREGRAVVVEGNLDVVASHKAGVENVVGSSGTALTEDQLMLLKRFTTTIVFSFDADAAGFKAAQRGLALARRNGFDVRVAVLPSDAGKDPDEAVQKDPELWRAAVAKTVPIMQFYIDRIVAGRDLSNVDDKRAVAALLIPELSQITDVIEREHWLQTVADLLRTDISILRDKSVASTASKPLQPLQPFKPFKPSRVSRDEQAAQSLLAIFIQHEPSRPAILSALHDRLIPSDALRQLYISLREEYHSPQFGPSHPTFFGRLQDRLQAQAGEALVPLLHQIALLGEEIVSQTPPDRVQVQVQELLDSLIASDRERRRKALEADIRQAEAAGDHEAVKRLIEEFNALRP